MEGGPKTMKMHKQSTYNIQALISAWLDCPVQGSQEKHGQIKHLWGWRMPNVIILSCTVRTTHRLLLIQAPCVNRALIAKQWLTVTFQMTPKQKALKIHHFDKTVRT